MNERAFSEPGAVTVVQFNEDLDDESKAKTPFWRKWKFYRTAFLLVTRCDLSKQLSVVP